MIDKASFDPGTRWVIKVGSSLLTDNGRGLSVERVSGWVDEIVAAARSGIEVVIVSSGAVAEGMARLGLKTRPRSLHALQAAAAVGQMGLIQLYESSFQRYGMHTAQVLLTHGDLRSRERYLNARSTLINLLELGVIPVVNENDTVVTDEFRFGDNDTLAALVANLIGAQTLLLMTDQDGVFTSDPRHNKSAELVSMLPAGDSQLDNMAGEGSAIGRGGMITKIRAARIAARSGASTVIASGYSPGCINNLQNKRVTGTLLYADKGTLASRKQWLAHLETQGRLVLDDGAVSHVITRGTSLLPVGVKEVSGDFTRGDMVSCRNLQGKEIARGLVNYNATECRQIAGRPSADIETILGYLGDEELIHRDNLVIM